MYGTNKLLLLLLLQEDSGDVTVHRVSPVRVLPAVAVLSGRHTDARVHSVCVRHLPRGLNPRVSQLATEPRPLLLEDTRLPSGLAGRVKTDVLCWSRAHSGRKYLSLE